MEKKISDCVVGDTIYTKHCMGGYQLAIIDKATTKTFQCHYKDREDQKFIINKIDGYKHGSRGSGRFGGFNVVHFYPITEEVLFDIRKRNTIYRMRQLKMDNLIINTNEDIDKIRKIYNELKSLIKE